MRLIKAIGIIIFMISSKVIIVNAQPIPVEVVMGNKYGSVNLAFSRNFAQNSRLVFFHMNTVQFGYKDKNKNDFILQDLMCVETIKNLRIASGVVYSPGGFNPTAGLQYVYGGEKLFFLCAPRVNIERSLSYDIMTIIQYKPKINEHVRLFAKLQLLNLFDSGGNLKSYQWMRLGLDIKGIQFGLAANLDENGPNPKVENNFGLFIRKELF
jgi:hypothetical protein